MHYKPYGFVLSEKQSSFIDKKVFEDSQKPKSERLFDKQRSLYIRKLIEEDIKRSKDQ